MKQCDLPIRPHSPSLRRARNPRSAARLSGSTELVEGSPKSIRDPQSSVDVLIIGAGPAGSTAAALLHRQGFSCWWWKSRLSPVRHRRKFAAAQHGPVAGSRAAGRDPGSKISCKNSARSFCAAGRPATSISPTNSPPAGIIPTRCRAPISTRRWPTPSPRAAWTYSTGTASRRWISPRAPPARPSNSRTEILRKFPARFMLDCSGYGRVLPRLLKLE